MWCWCVLHRVWMRGLRARLIQRACYRHVWLHCVRGGHIRPRARRKRVCAVWQRQLRKPPRRINLGGVHSLRCWALWGRERRGVLHPVRSWLIQRAGNGHQRVCRVSDGHI